MSDVRDGLGTIDEVEGALFAQHWFTKQEIRYTIAERLSLADIDKVLRFLVERGLVVKRNKAGRAEFALVGYACIDATIRRAFQDEELLGLDALRDDDLEDFGG